MELEPEGPRFVPDEAPRPVGEGDVVAPGDGTVAELEHPDGSVTRIDGGSVSVLAQLTTPEGDPYVVVHLHEGRSWQRTVPGDGHRYELRTATLAAAGADATFAVVGEPDGGCLVVALDGRVDVTTQAAGAISLDAHQAVLVSPDGHLALLKALAPDDLSRDDWLRVNRILDNAGRALAGEPVIAIPAAREPAPDEPAAHPPVEVPAPAAQDLVVDEHRRPWGWVAAASIAVVLVLAGALAATSGDQPASDVAQNGPSQSIERTTTTVAAPTSTTAVPTTTAPSTTAPAAVPTATIAPRRCEQQGDTITYVAGLTNTAAAPAVFDVRVGFVDRGGRTVAEVTTAVGPLAPNASTEWQATGRVPADLRNSGASCIVLSITGRRA